MELESRARPWAVCRHIYMCRLEARFTPELTPANTNPDGSGFLGGRGVFEHALLPEAGWRRVYEPRAESQKSAVSAARRIAGPVRVEALADGALPPARATLLCREQEWRSREWTMES